MKLTIPVSATIASVCCGLIAVAIMAAETPVEPPSTLPSPKETMTNEPTWATVRGTVKVVRFTNAEPWRYEKVASGNSNAPIAFRVTDIISREYMVPVQVINWWNPESNIWETVELALTAPRFVRETVRTNVP